MSEYEKLDIQELDHPNMCVATAEYWKKVIDANRSLL